MTNIDLGTADLDRFGPDDLRRRAGAKWTRHGPPVLAAWIADMDFPVAPPVRRALLEAIELGDLGYADFDGQGGLAGLFAARMAERYGWVLDPALVLVRRDVVQSIMVAIETCTEPGDGVLVQTPVYPPFLQAVAETGRRLVANPLVLGPARHEYDPEGWRCDGAVGRDALDRSRPRMLLLCNPHNPTGRVFDATELAALAALANERDLVVVADEIHAELAWPGHEHIPLATLGPEVATRTITLTSATKAFNLAGLPCSVAAFGHGALLDRFRGVADHLVGGVGGLALTATAAAWRDGAGWQAELLAYLEINRRLLAEAVGRLMPAVGHRPPEATYVGWLDCRALALKPDPFSWFLERAGVALSDGAAFGEPGRGHVRLNFATPRAILTEVVERMAASLPA